MAGRYNADPRMPKMARGNNGDAPAPAALKKPMKNQKPMPAKSLYKKVKKAVGSKPSSMPVGKWG